MFYGGAAASAVKQGGSSTAPTPSTLGPAAPVKEVAALTKASAALDVRRKFTRLLVQAMAAVSMISLWSSENSSPPEHIERRPPTDDTAFRAIVEILCASYAKGASVSYGMLCDIPGALSRMAYRLSAVSLHPSSSAELSRFNQRRAELKNNVLILAAQVSSLAMQRCEASGLAAPAAVAAALTPFVALTPALAQALSIAAVSQNSSLSCSPPPQHLIASAVRPFRNLWVHLLFSRVADQPQSIMWPQAWRAAVRAIAVHSPLLIARGAPSSFDRDVGIAAGGAPSSNRTSFILDSFVAEQVQYESDVLRQWGCRLCGVWLLLLSYQSITF
jgi:hypothetical protein